MGPMRARTHTLLVVAALLGTGAAPAWSQDTAIDPRWLAYPGWWVPDDVTAAMRLGISSTLQARAAASAPLAIDDVVEASRNVDGAVIEAWLVARGARFALDAKRLIALADAGVSPRVIDLMVALSYPKAFAIDAATRQGERLAANSYGVGTAPADYFASFDPFCSSYDFMYPYSYDC